MLKLIVAIFSAISFLRGNITDDQELNAWNVPQRINLPGRVGLVYPQQGRLAVGQEELKLELTVGSDNSKAHHVMALRSFKLAHTALRREQYDRSIVVVPDNFLVKNDFWSHLCVSDYI